jgi:hypothetical protein
LAEFNRGTIFSDWNVGVVIGGSVEGTDRYVFGDKLVVDDVP